MAGAIIMPIVKSSGRSVSDVDCQANLRSIAQAALMYATENDDRLPIRGWNVALRKFQPDDLVFACPVQRRIDPRSSGYALSSDVAGKENSSFDTPNLDVFFFDSKVTQPGVTDKPGTFPDIARHGNGRSNNVVYLDGHVKPEPTQR